MKRPLATLDRLFYTIPVHHNPTGYTLSNAKRVKLLEPHGLSHGG